MRRTPAAVAVVGFLAVMLIATARRAWADGQPNFIIIYLDDAGYADVSCFGASYETPNIDQMAEEGMRLTDFYVCAGVCTPSRAGLLTGRYPIRYGLHNGVIQAPDTHGLPLSEVTLAEQLGALGYRTGLVGKWHLGTGDEGINGIPDTLEGESAETTDPNAYMFMPMQQGFDYYYGTAHSNDTYGYKAWHGTQKDWGPLRLILGNEVVERFDGEPNPEDLTNDTRQRFLTRRFTQESQKFIRDAVEAEQPFFLYIAHSMPHWPISRSPSFTGVTAAAYSDVMTEIDWSVGQILETLAEQGIDENTLVIFTSDNGPWLTHLPDAGSADPLREGKGCTFDGAMRVPFIARWPGQIDPNTVVSDPAINMDLFPTFVGLAGGSMPAGVTIDGRDIWPVLSGTGSREAPGEEFEFFYYRSSGSYFGNRPGFAAYRRGDWKIKTEFYGTVSQRYIGNPDSLWDMSTPEGRAEQPSANLQSSNMAIWNDMKAELDAWNNQFGLTTP